MAKGHEATGFCLPRAQPGVHAGAAQHTVRAGAGQRQGQRVEVAGHGGEGRGRVGTFEVAVQVKTQSAQRGTSWIVAEACRPKISAGR